MLYFCHHFQRIGSVELSTSHRAKSGLNDFLLLNYQMLLDDGNRIIIPQGNFKYLRKPTYSEHDGQVL